MELSWQQFRNQEHIRFLTESEQTRQYYFYLDSLANQNLRQPKGNNTKVTTPFEGFILQESGHYLLQEDGDRIYV